METISEIIRVLAAPSAPNRPPLAAEAAAVWAAGAVLISLLCLTSSFAVP